MRFPKSIGVGIGWLGIICLPCLLSAQVKVVTLDQPIAQGEIVKIEKKESLFLVLKTGAAQKSINCLDIVEVVCQEAATQPSEIPCIVMNDGSRLYGKIVDGTDNAIAIQSAAIGIVTLGISKIREIRLKNGLDELDLIPDSDVLYFKTGDVMTGAIEQFGKDYVQIQHPQLGSRKEALEKLTRIVLAQLETPPQRSDRLTAVLLAVDQTRLFGELIEVQKGGLLFEVQYLQQKIVVPFNQIQRLFFINGRFKYLSDLPANQYQFAYIPYFEGGKNEAFLPRLDQNWARKIMRLGGQVFYKGIGVISRTEIKIALKGEYRRFQACLGIDDMVKEVMELNLGFPWVGGSVIFQIFADGVKLFDSGVVRYSNAPKIVDIDVAGKNSLLLVVDWADQDSPGFANDFANWAGARLVK